MEENLENKIDLEVQAETPIKTSPKRMKKVLKILAVGGGVVFLLIGFIVIFGVLPGLKLKDHALALKQELEGISSEVQSQNLNQSIDKLASSKIELAKLSDDYQKLSWLNIVPYFNGFYKDGKRLINSGQYLLEAGEIAIDSLKPYSDLLGLEGKEESQSQEAMTTEQRLVLALDTLDKIQPSLDKIGEKLNLASSEVDQINPGRYPVTLFGKNIRKNVADLVTIVDGTTRMVTEVKPIITYLRPLLGIPDEKRYLILFQNDAELRPTGGFLTAYAILSVNKGSIKSLGSFDIYSLDARFGNRLPPPAPIKQYHKNVFYWHLRDMNLSPDFKVSMETFLENYGKVEDKRKIDGIIAVDTKVLVDILRVLGPIGVADWGKFSAENDPRCNCPQVVYELERLADKPIGTLNTERKAMIGPLMHSILLNIMQSPRKRWPEFFNIAFTNVQEKHLLFSFSNPEIQGAIEALNAAGRIKEYDGDYLHINDCNFAGAKSNMFIRVNVDQEINIGADGEVTKTIKIDYQNPVPASNCNLEAGELCLNGLYRDWLRVYVPKGSELIESSGSEIDVKTYEDLGKTVFEAFYGDRAPLRPQGKAELTFKYKLPFKVQKGQEYRLLIQKQPGTYGYEYMTKLDGQQQEFELKTDRELRF